MSKASRAGNAVGKIVTYILVVLVVLGVAGMIAYFTLRSQGVTYYVEFDGKRYFGNTDGGSLALADGTTHEFTVKSLSGGEVNFDVKVQSNSASNFAFTVDGVYKQFYSTTAENNDYSEIFGLQKDKGGFSLTVPDGFSVKEAVEIKYGGNVEFGAELENDKAYFVISVTAEESAVNLWFAFDVDVEGITLNPPSITF